MTNQDIINGLAGALYGIDSAKNIYTEYVEQGFDIPCFYIHPLVGNQNSLTGNFYEKRTQFDVQFYPVQNGTEKRQCLDMADELIEGLEYVTIEGYPLKTYNLNHEIVDKILHVTLQINANVEKQITPAPDMADLVQDSGTKGWLNGWEKEKI